MSTTELRRYDRTIKKRDPRLTALESNGLPTLEASYPVRVRAEGTVAGQRITWVRELRHAEGRTTNALAQSIR